MVLTQVCLLIISIRSIEIFIQYIYNLLKKFIKARNGETYSVTSYKRLSTDCTYEFHAEVVSMASAKGTTIKEYVLGAVMMRLKKDRRDPRKNISLKNS